MTILYGSLILRRYRLVLVKPILNAHSRQIAEDATEITLTAPVQLEPSTTPKTPGINFTTETEVTPIDSVVTAALVEGQPQIVSEAEKVLQVIICQKHLFLHQLSQNMTIDCSLQDQCEKTIKIQ